MTRKEIIRRLTELYESFDPDNTIDFAEEAMEVIHNILKEEK